MYQHIRDIYSKLLEEITFDVYMLTSKTKKIIYMTSASAGINQYYVERISNEDVVITKIKRIYIWELKKFADRQDAVLIDMYKMFAHFFNDGFLIPNLVRQVLDIDKKNENDPIEVPKKYLKRMHKYSFEITHDHDALKFFYEKMHVPYIKKRYGNDANIESFNVFEKILKNGELMFIKLNGENVAGELYEINGDICFLRKNGVLDEKFIKDGALLATYYFPIIIAKEKKLKSVDFGRSGPFLLDGILRHKNYWGGKICEDKTAKRMIYLRNVLFEQPFIYMEDKKLKVNNISAENEKLIKEYERSGLEFNIIK